MTFTASSRERIQHCPSSAALPQINVASVWSDIGNAGHEAASKFLELVRLGEDPICAVRAVPPEWHQLCDALAPFAASLRSEIAVAYNVVTGQARILGENIERKYRLLENEVAGTADLAGVIDGEVVVIDGKTGYGAVTHPDRNPQLAMLALGFCRAWGCDRARVAIVTCHEGDEPYWQWASMEIWDLDQTAADMLEEFDSVNRAVEAVASGKTPNVSTGSWCRYCPALPVCPAHTALIRRLASGDEGDELEMMLPLDRRTAGLAWERLGHAKRMLQRIEAACHAFLDEQGEMELPNGKLLRKVKAEGNERLDGEEVYNVMLQLVGPDVANEAVERKATKKGMEAALRNAFGRAGAAKAREVLDEVRKRGGVSRPMTTKLVEVDPAKEIGR